MNSSSPKSVAEIDEIGRAPSSGVTKPVSTDAPMAASAHCGTLLNVDSRNVVGTRSRKRYPAHDVLRPGGCFVLGDVVVPERPEDAQIEIDWVVDLPDTAADQLQWLADSGFDPDIVWSHRDLAVLRATRR